MASRSSTRRVRSSSSSSSAASSLVQADEDPSHGSASARPTRSAARTSTASPKASATAKMKYELQSAKKRSHSSNADHSPAPDDASSSNRETNKTKKTTATSSRASKRTTKSIQHEQTEDNVAADQVAVVDEDEKTADHTDVCEELEGAERADILHDEEETADGLTEYERQRLANIRSNMARMAMLNLPALANEIAPRAKPRSASRGQKKQPKEPAVPVRRSQRALGKPAVSYTEIKELTLPAQPPGRARKVGDLPFAPTNSVDTGDNTKFVTLLGKNLAGPSKHGAAAAPKPPGLNSLKLKEEGVRVVPERIYCMRWLSSCEPLIVAAGDKWGRLGLLLVKPDTAVDDDEEARIFTYEPHSRPISDISSSSWDISKVFTSSYDSSVRCMDMQKEMFTEVYVGDEDDDSFTNVAIDNSSTHMGRMLYVSDHRGCVTMIDIRAPSVSHKKHELHERKVSAVSCHPTNGYSLLTASNDNTVCVWDARKLKHTKSYVHRLPHTRAVSGAAFSPSGRRILSVAYDDYVRLWTCEENKWDWSAAPLRLAHNNQTGRWITPFRPAWAGSDVHFVVGNMTRAVDVYTIKPAKDGTDSASLVSKQHELLTAIPAINAVHPSCSFVASGTAGGKVYIWHP